MLQKLFNLILKSQILQIAAAISMVILAASFGIGMIWQGYHGCFGEIMQNGIKLVSEVK